MNTTLQTKIRADIAKLNNLTSLPLPASGSWPESVHQFDVASINALKMALAARRPLLLYGDPGTGKSQLARAAAIALGRMFVYDVVNAHTESQDLLWRFDAVGRLAEAQSLQGLPNCTPEQRQTVLDTKRYISPGPLWWALCWETANTVYQKSQYRLTSPEKPPAWQQADGSVLLLDEIDKANIELPNGLLEILGNNAINIPWLNTAIGGKDKLPPLVIITSNKERELPAAFVRRCLVLNLELPKDDVAFMDMMMERGALHYSVSCSPAICREAAKQLLDARKFARDKGIPNPPGQAEYLDMLRALAMLGDTEAEQQAMLTHIAGFALRKYPVAYGR